MSANKKSFLELEAKLRDLRGHIDNLDGTEFGKLDRAFDALAKITDEAIDMADTLEVQMDWDSESAGADA